MVLSMMNICQYLGRIKISLTICAEIVQIFCTESVKNDKKKNPNPLLSIDEKPIKTLQIKGLGIGARIGARTLDPLIKSEMRYIEKSMS